MVDPSLVISLHGHFVSNPQLVSQIGQGYDHLEQTNNLQPNQFLPLHLPLTNFESCLIDHFWQSHFRLERMVKEVSVASENVFGLECRNGYVHACLHARKVMPKVASKKDIFPNL